jgi:hypothetical protein
MRANSRLHFYTIPGITLGDSGVKTVRILAMHEVIKECNGYRIIRMVDEESDMDNLKGDCFSPNVHPKIPKDRLLKEEREFERRVSDEGVWGYELQKWNPETGAGWEFVDSIWGFVGADWEGSGYDEDMYRQMK